jgi:hypothetical protein
VSQPPDEQYSSPSYTSAYQPASYDQVPYPPPPHQPGPYEAPPPAYQPQYEPAQYQAPPPGYQPGAYQQDVYQQGAYQPGSVERPPRSGRMVAIAAAGVAVLLGLVGVAVTAGVLTRGGTSHAGSSPTAVLPPPATTAPPAPTPTDVPSPTPSTPGRPTQPADALTLTDQQAVDELTLEADEATSVVSVVQGAWVPQVSSKCVGISVDIGPNWMPDGADDTAHVTIQQILAFHLGMHGRFSAVTVRPTQVGIRNDRATSGACSGQMIWMSIVPQRYGSAADANAWCVANVPPVKECAARYVAGPGQSSTLVLRG